MGKDSKNSKILWNNYHPSSTTPCRPIELIFQRESPELIKDKSSLIDAEFASLQNSSFTIDNFPVEVGHELIFSMIDGKVIQILTDNKSPQVCVLCGATPKEMNLLDTVTIKEVSITSLKYGLSPLHA